MKSLKALIVEDNAFMASVLRDMLNEYANSITVSGIATTGKAALSQIMSVKPDVVFLDIELPDMTGFELLRQLEKINFKTVFTTSHSHYAITAFRFNAIDYLIKPVNENELNEAVRRVLKSANHSMGVKNALFNLNVQNFEEQKLILPQQNGTLRLPLKQITHIEGERNYSIIHLSKGKKELSSKNLAYFEEILIDKKFYRCHRSHLVNGFHIKALTKGNFVLTNGTEIGISRRKETEAKAWFFGLEPKKIK